MRILVVEDDRLLNNTLCYNLDAAGYTVDSALTKSAASDFLTKQDYDLIVLDVNLPDGNGFDFCREVKERRPDTAVIFLTANDMESDMLKGYELNDMFKVYMNNNIKLKPSTRANYLYLWDFYVKEEPFANMPLPQIHRSDILAFYTKLLKHGFAINSLESINTIVHPTLEMAVDDDYIRKNPSKGIYRKLKTDGSAPKPKRRIALTKTQQQNFLRFIAKSPTYSHWLPIMTVLLGTGMRVAECTGITKSDINLSENTISVNHNLIYRVIDGKAGFHITTPKTESGTRIIPILYPEVAEQLRLQIETIDALYPDDQLVLGGVHGFVFRNRTGSFMSAHNINRAIERISVTYNMEEMDQAELEDREPDLLPHFSVHNLRHTFCTRLCESTNDVKFIQQVMGHADFSTTMDIYTHITQENMQEKAKNISVNMKLM